MVKKSLQLHLAQQSFERFVFKILYNTAIPSSAAIERFFSTEKDILKPKRSRLLELDDFSQMVLFLKCDSEYSFSIVSSVLSCVTVR